MNIATNKRYSYRLIAAYNDGTEKIYSVAPAVKDIVINDSRESGEMFYRKTFEGEFVFIDKDADIINNASPSVRYTMRMIDKEGSVVCNFIFRKTDGKVDKDHHLFSVKPRIDDGYKSIIDGQDNEYNLHDILHRVHTVKLQQRPCIQVGVNNDTEMHIWMGSGSHVKKDAAEWEDYTTIIDSYYFGMSLGFSAVGHGGSYEGVYTADGTDGASLTTPFLTWNAYSADGNYVIHLNRNYLYDPLIPGYRTDWYFELCLASDESYIISRYPSDHTQYLTTDEIMNITHIEFGTNVTEYDIRVWMVFGRVLNNVSGFDLGDNDIDKMTYKKSIRKNDFHLFISSNTSPTDNGYRKVEGEERWYAPPSYHTPLVYFPVAEDSWFQGISLWGQPYYDMTEYNRDYTQEFEIPDFYTISEAIKGVLGQCAPDIEYNEDAAHSIFLSDSVNPVTGNSQGIVYITQKSNLLEYGYDYEAWKAPVKLSQIFTFLRNAFNCYWDVYTDDYGHRHLRIEHIKWYLNGGSYSTTGYDMRHDLRQIHDSMNRHPYSWRSNNWTYKTDDYYTRMEFRWMDTQSEPFVGFPIYIPERLIISEDRKTENRAIDWFSTDIDFLLAVKSECSSDGFLAVMTGTRNSNVVSSDFVKIKDVVYNMQNERLSFVYLHQRFFPYFMAAEKVMINEQEVNIQPSMRMKLRKNTVKFRLSEGVTAAVNAQYVTDAGTGIASSLKHDLSSDTYEAELEYDID